MGLPLGMLPYARSTPVLEVVQGSGPKAAPRSTPRATIHYDGISRARWTTWLAALISAALHAVVILGFNPPASPKKIARAEEPVEQLLMMPDLKEEEEEPPRELSEDEELVSPPTVTVPMLADLPVLVPLNASFVQQLDLTIPIKSDANASKLTAVPVNIQRGRPQDGGIKNLFNLAELDRVPEPLIQNNPDYPFEMKREGINGRVRVGFIVDVSGKVILPYIVSSTHRGFERAALDAVMRWKFRPGLKGGRKVNTRVEQPMVFTLEDGGGEAG